jgi:hypothetical protein
MRALDAALVHAHEAGDRAALVRLYSEAAGAVSDRGAAAFFLTQAYVFALEAGMPEAAGLCARLRAWGCEE